MIDDRIHPHQDCIYPRTRQDCVFILIRGPTFGAVSHCLVRPWACCGVKGFPIEAQERLQKRRTKQNNKRAAAKVQARRKEQAIASDLIVCPWVGTSDGALNDAAHNGFEAIESYLGQHRNAAGAGRPCMINVFGASTGTEGNSIEEEGMRSTLTTRGYDAPVLVVRCASWRTLAAGQPRVQVWWTCLDVQLRLHLEPPALMPYDSGTSRFASSMAKKKTQLLVEAAAAELNIAVVWRRAGQGGGKRKPPYHALHRAGTSISSSRQITKFFLENEK